MQVLSVKRMEKRVPYENDVFIVTIQDVTKCEFWFESSTKKPDALMYTGTNHDEYKDQSPPTSTLEHVIKETRYNRVLADLDDRGYTVIAELSIDS